MACPDGVAGVAAVWWARLTAALVKRVQASDVPMLAQACHWLAESDRCREIAAGLDPTTPEHGRALRSAGVAAAAADRVLADFGLTPAGRTKLPAPPPAGVITWE